MELQTIADYIEIRELTARYNRALDDGRLDECVACFTPDGVLQTADFGSIEGRENLRAAFDSLGYGSVHLSLDATISVDGDRATQECSIIMAKRSADRTTSCFVTTGRYTDTVVRTPDGWRFAHRYSVPDLGQEGMAAAYPSFDPEA